MRHTSRPEGPSRSSDVIVLECDLPDSPQKVWKALTVPELLARWLLPNDMRPEEGARFSFERGPPGRIDCTVLKAEPHRLLQMSWRSAAAEEGGQDKLDTVVTFELFPTITGGTLLRLVHSGFDTSAQAPVATLASGLCRLRLPRQRVRGVHAGESAAKFRWAA